MWPGGESARALAARGQPLRIVAKGRGWLKKHSLLAKAVPTSIGFAFGDFLTQYMHWKGRQTKQPFSYEWQRGAKMGVVGAVLAGPVGLGLLRWMDGNVMTSNPTGLPAMTVKFTLDQVVGCLMWQLAYCAIHPPYRMAAETLLSSLGTHLEAQTADVRRKLQPQPQSC